MNSEEETMKPVLGLKGSRREFLVALGTACGAGVTRKVVAEPVSNHTGLEVCLFSKHLQWLGLEEMADTTAGLGFDGIDLTVRPGGHVPPLEVGTELPRAVRAAKAAGLTVPIMTTAITDPEDPATETILATAAENDIRHYRLGYYRYPEQGSIEPTLQEAREKLAGLAKLNEKYGVTGDYQNHAGVNYFGASIWDLREATTSIDSRWIGCQFDLRHATVEGGMNWPVDFRAVSGRVHTIVAKDFRWRVDEKGTSVEDCPLGRGICRFSELFGMLIAQGFSGPISLHLEYPLEGVENGARSLSAESSEVVFSAMKRDLGVLRGTLTQAGF